MMQKMLYLWGMCCLLSLPYAGAQSFEIISANAPELPAEQVVEDLCFGPGIEVVGVNFQGLDNAVGIFNGAAEYVGIDSGFVMTTGRATTSIGNVLVGADRPSVFNASVTNGSPASYPGLMDLANNATIRDVAVYTITFVPTQDSILFRYVFASEEYPNFVCSPFNDVFGFFLTGPAQNGVDQTINLATVPGGSLPVSINSINSGAAGNHFSVDPDTYCMGELGSLENAAFYVPTQGFPAYDGYTTVFEAKAAVQPCQTYTMDLVLADAGDALFDSAIFFEANSFCSFGNSNLISSNVERDNPILIEGCEQEPIVFDLSNVGPAAFPIAYRVMGEATAGQDYEGGVILGSIDEPVSSFEIPIQTIADGIGEGAEQLQVVFQSVECFSDTTTLYIIDPLTVIGPNFVNCSSDGIELTVGYGNLSLMPPTDEELDDFLNNLRYEWSTGDTTRTITVNPSTTTTYTVIYGNELNNCMGELTITVGSAESEINEEICFNEPGIVVNGTLYNLENLSGTEVIPGGAVGGCDSTVVINLTPAAQGMLETTLCDYEIVEVNGTVYDKNNPTGTEILAGAAADGCDSLVYIDLNFFPQSMGIVMQTLCAEDSLLINGNTYDINNSFGTEIFVGADQNGCDSIVEVLLDFYPSFSSDLAVNLPEGGSYELAGQSFTASGSYTLALTDQNGCDSTINLEVTVELASETITDTILLNDPQEYCFDTSIFQEVASIENVCPEDGGNAINFALDAATNCVTYTATSPGVESACIVLCDALGNCDTTYFVISGFNNFLDAVDDYDSTAYNQTANIAVLENDWFGYTADGYEDLVYTLSVVAQPSFGTAIVETDNTISFEPDLTACDQEDQFQYAICNQLGCDTATVFLYLEDTDDLCDAVWPGDVVPDGIVNQGDFWAVGLGFNLPAGIIRPNASLEWVAQPAVNWPNFITFIQYFNAKHADTNGDGIINTADYEAIDLNFGLTHGFSAPSFDFPEREVPCSFEALEKEEEEWYSAILTLGTNEKQVQDFYGLYFELDFDPTVIDAESIHIDWTDSWSGEAGSDLNELQKLDGNESRLRVVNVRNNQLGRDGFGTIGRVYFKLKDQQATFVEMTAQNWQLLKSNGAIFDLSDIALASSLLTSTIDEIATEEDILLYPNPTSEQLIIRFHANGQTVSANTSDWNYQIFSLAGEKISANTGRGDEVRIDVSGCSTGVYVLRLQSGDKVYNRQFTVIKHGR